MPGIVIEKLKKTYTDRNGNSTEALSDINLNVKEGEFLCILGPSGCGKSTLLEIIAGLQKPTEGKILVEDAEVKGASKDLGFVFQDASLFPWRTIKENIEFGLEVRGIKKAERNSLMEKYINLVNLKGFENKYPHQLSGGMRQRAGLARTLINNPKVLLMDEPFSAVDHLTRLQLQKEVTDIWEKEKKTVVFITHDVSEAVYLGDRVVLLSPRPSKIRKIFEIPVKRERSRDDSLIFEIESKIYRAINSLQEIEPEYYL